MGEKKKIIIESEELSAAIWVLTHIPMMRNWCLTEWDKFENSLLYENRFTADSVFLDVIKEKEQQATRVIDKGTVFYRARLFNQKPTDRFLHYMRKVLSKQGLAISCFLDGIGAIQVDNWLALLSQKNDNEPFVIQANEALQLMKRARFKGYGAKDSTAPPADLCVSFRANPDHIRYLYLAEDKETPVYEIRSALNQCVSIAKLKCNKPLKLYDLTVESGALSLTSASEIKSHFAILYLCGMFSQTNNNMTSKYLPTQYIAETIKRMGFDGIRYISSLHEGGYNVVLFNPEDCTVLSSDLVEISKINIESDKPDIYKSRSEKQTN